MASEPQGPKDLLNTFNERYRHYQAEHNEMTELLNIKEFGTLPSRFDDYFPPDSHVHVINNIAMAWDDTTARAAKLFGVKIPPRGDGPRAKAAAEKVEQIGQGYLEAGRFCKKQSYKTLMNLWCSDLIGLGDAVGMVVPNHDYQTPNFVHRDPRTHLPPIGWAPWKDMRLNETMFAYLETVGSLKLKYPDRAREIDLAYGKKSYGGSFGARGRHAYGGDVNAMPVWVGEYISDDAWYFAALEGNVVLAASESGDKGHPGVCSVWSFTRPSLMRRKGRSRYTDQISLMAALARMITQKIDYYDKTLYATTYISEPVGGEVEEGPGGVTVLKSMGGEKPFVQTTPPANPVDADQMIGMVEGLARWLNRNPDLAGDRDSAKAMQAELDNTVNSEIQDGIWPQFTEQGLPKLLSDAALIDRNVWGNTKKKAQGKRSNTPFNVSYTPNVDLDGYENAWQIEVGIGMAGYRGVMDLLQRFGSGTISLSTLLEQLPDVMEPEREKRRIQTDQLEKLLWAAFEAKAAQGLLNPAGLAEVRRLVGDKDKDLFDAIEEVQEAGRLEIPPAPPEMSTGPPGMPGGGGPMADPLAMLSGMPPIEALRQGA